MMKITYVGHATVLIELDGVRLLTDPVLRKRVLHLRRKPPLLSETLFENLTTVLISHTHLDHFDLPTLERLGKCIHLIVPDTTASWIRKRGFCNVQGCTIGEEIPLGSLVVHAVPANHHTSRFSRSLCQNCLGYYVRGSKSIYFAGDTDLFSEMSQVGQELDIALLPVWGWGPNLGPGHLDPYRASQALQLLKPKVVIPIHWGTLYPLGFSPSRARFLIDPPHQFACFAHQLAPEVQVLILNPGESLTFG